MKVSVIIPTYKPGAYIYECLDSLVNQTLSKDLWEVVLILNGCNEPYYSDINNRYSKLLPNFRLIQTNISGVSNARNIGISESKGEYVTFIDDDDIVSINYLEALYSVASPNAITISNIMIFSDDDNNYTFRENSRTKTFMYLRERNNVNVYNARKLLNAPWAKLISRSVIGEVRYNLQLKNGEDSVFMFEISKNCKQLKFTGSSAIYFVRQRNDSASRKYKPLIYWIKNAVLMDYSILKPYLSDICDYNIWLFLNRFIAPWKVVLKNILKK